MCVTPTSASLDETSPPLSSLNHWVLTGVEKGADFLHPCVGFLEHGGQRRTGEVSSPSAVVI